ncbi:MAG: isoleucine--tRNA ligase [Hyphomonadaceae bacterium]
MTDTPDTKDSGRDYRDTLFLPETAFPMRGGLPKAEPNWIARWDEMGLYKKLRADAKARNAKPWLLHDGPPYANGHIHLGTAMNKIVKDIIVRSHQMTGHDASYVPGWDCHGLPIEWKVEEEFRQKGRSKDDVTPGEFRARCREYAKGWVDVQASEFRALGVEGEWDNPYLTMRPESEAKIVSEFLDIAMGGRLVRGAKPVMWSPVEKTALAEAEVEYHDRKVPVIWVKFPVPQVSERGLGEMMGGPYDEIIKTHSELDGASVVIWTTTPWTIPANQAVCYNPKITYGLYEVGEVMTEEELGFAPYAKAGERLVIADARADDVMSGAKVSAFERISDVDMSKLVQLTHPLSDLADMYRAYVPTLQGDHVTDDAGTGFVHTAPAHGEDDYNAWIAAGHSSQSIRDIVDDGGCYRDEVTMSHTTFEVPEALRGLDIIRTSGKKRGQPGKANPEVIKLLAESGNLLARGLTIIRDAHSWRSKAPVIRRATPQWFIAMDTEGRDGKTLRDLAMTGLEQTEFFPPTGRNRLTSMVAGRPDWLVSRQRNWGVPLTIFVNEDGQPHTKALAPHLASAVNKRIVEAVSKGGVEAWFDTEDSVFLGEETGGHTWTKVTDVLDVWFDSGTTHAFCMRDRGIIDEDKGQVDLYLEGSDQHRGWFQSSLLESCATRGMPPYKQILTHGFIVDADGKKMSKSIGNTVEPQQIQKQYGIEILRLWSASGDFTEDLRISDEIIKGSVETYRRLRNTFRYLLGALDGFTPEEAVARSEMPGLEQWVLHRLSELDETVRAAYDVYDFKKIMAAIINFCAVDLSAVYFDIRKDSLYCDMPDELRRRAARTVMDEVLLRLLTWLAPIMPFTTEEAFLMSRFGTGEGTSVHLLQFPETPADWSDPSLAARWEKIFAVRRTVTGALEIERREKRIGSSLEAAPEVYITNADLLKLVKSEHAADLFITSGAVLKHADAPVGAFTLDDVEGVGVVPAKASGIKCARSWKYFDPAKASADYPDLTPRDAEAVRRFDKENR